MKCENCARHVKEALYSDDGIFSGDVDLAEKAAITETI